MTASSADSGTLRPMVVQLAPEGLEFFELTDTYLGKHDRQRVREAYEWARQKHGGQRRQSGEPFLTHPLTVAYYLAEYRLDAPTLMAALLHDVAEDAGVTIEEIVARYGPDVGRLVDGVTKLKDVAAGVARGRKPTAEDARDTSLLKLLDATTTDMRVVIIKLFDRLHNMRTIRALPLAKQRQKALETLSVYAPIANRLGIWRMKTELESLSLQVVDNEAYRVIRGELEHHFHKQQTLYALVSRQIIECLKDNGLQVVNVLPSPESIHSVYKALYATSSSYHNAASPVRVVALLEDVPACYLALGYLHQLWRPVPGKFDDYIALPRDNMYRALHTTVIHTSGEPLKIRFQTRAMNEVSELGVLARWVYASTPLWTQGIAERVQALFANISENMSLEAQSASTGVKGLVEDVFGQQIMVYTPRGDVLELPYGATPVDFAYTIHTEVGNQCQTAYVNEKPYPLNRALRDGDQVRIVKSGWARPQHTWLDEDLGFLATSRARAHVRRWFRRLPNDLAVSEGRKLLQDELAILGFEETGHDGLAETFGFSNVDEFYHALGRAELLPTTVATHLMEREWQRVPLRSVGSPVRSGNGQEFIIAHAKGRRLRLCRACNARPGDAIVGVIRLDGGVTVHRQGCHTLRPDPLADRTIKLAWARDGARQVRVVTVQLDVYDRTGLLFDIAELLRGADINIAAINTPPSAVDGTMRVVLDLEIATPRQLVRILHQAHALVNVFAVRCLHSRPAPGKKGAGEPAGGDLA